ncbi:MAG: DsbA family protein [Candidatus Magasanikbacteria bacterium]
MEDNKPNTNTSTPEPRKLWYKTGAGITFLSVIFVIILSATAFAGMVGYYAWQLKYGDAEQLVKQFSTESFSQDPGLATMGIENLEQKDVSQYIRDFDPVLGKSDNPITIVSFIDFECPYCQGTYLTFKNVITKYESLVKVVFKHLPLENLHPGASLSAQASACANAQNKFWEYYNILFLDSDHSQDNLINLASQINLEPQSFSACLDSDEYRNNINKDLTDAVELGLVGTPTYFVNGYKMEGALTPEQWDQIILQVYNN